MKLNNELGFDQETTLEYFKEHIPSKEELFAIYGAHNSGVYALFRCNRTGDVSYTHIDTYLNKDKTRWRVQIRQTYHVEGFGDYSNWYLAKTRVHALGYGKRTDHKTGQIINVEMTDLGVEVTYTFAVPFVEK